jgi:hypothetical protein
MPPPLIQVEIRAESKNQSPKRSHARILPHRLWIAQRELRDLFAFAEKFCPCNHLAMTHQDIQKQFEEIETRLQRHSLFYMDEVLPAIQKLRMDIENLWISNDRFTELERAVADIAQIVYDRKTRHKADSRLRPRPNQQSHVRAN